MIELQAKNIGKQKGIHDDHEELKVQAKKIFLEQRLHEKATEERK